MHKSAPEFSAPWSSRHRLHKQQFQGMLVEEKIGDCWCLLDPIEDCVADTKFVLPKIAGDRESDERNLPLDPLLCASKGSSETPLVSMFDS